MSMRIVINGCELNTFDMDVESGAEYLVTVGKTASSVKVERVIAEPDDALIEENKKLRKLVDLYEYGVTHDGSAAESLEWSRRVEEMRRELGIKDGPWAKDWQTH